MVVSQRLSEVSETIFSQCSNFISLRLTNAVDQSYIKSLLPDLSAGIGDLLPNLGQGEFLIVGDALDADGWAALRCLFPNRTRVA
jgi:DNA helicase HerA-like ATPase